MSGDLLSASLGLFAGLGAAGIGGLVADDYKRFRNGSGLAGALAGELNSYTSFWPMLFEELDALASPHVWDSTEARDRLLGQVLGLLPLKRHPSLHPEAP